MGPYFRRVRNVYHFWQYAIHIIDVVKKVRKAGHIQFASWRVDDLYFVPGCFNAPDSWRLI